MEKLEHLYFAGGNVKWFICCGKHFGGSTKKINKITIKPSNSSPRCVCKILKAGTQTNKCIHMLTSVIFTIVERWELKCSLTDE